MSKIHSIEAGGVKLIPFVVDTTFTAWATKVSIWFPLIVSVSDPRPLRETTRLLVWAETTRLLQ